MQGIFGRADEVTRDLISELETCAQKGEVSERAKNLFHEVLVKIRSSLDFAMHRIFDRHTSLASKENVKVYFPIVVAADTFDDKLKRLGLSCLKDSRPELYQKILQAQPFSTKRRDLLWLRELSDRGKHVELAPWDCLRQKAKEVTRPDGFKVVFTEGVEFLGPDGSPVDPTSGCDVEDIIWATFNVYRSSGKITMPESMCRILCQDTRRYVGHLLDLI